MVAPLAQRFVRIKADTSGFLDEVRKGTTGAKMTAIGAAAGKDWASGFRKTAEAELAKMRLKVKVTPDMSGFEDALKKTIGGGADNLGKQWGETFATAAAAQAQAVLDRTSINIPVDVENASVNTPTAGPVNIGINVDTAKAEADLRAWVDRVDGKFPIRIPIVFTNGGFDGGDVVQEELRRQIQSSQRAIGAGKGVKVPVVIDGSVVTTGVSQAFRNVRPKITPIVDQTALKIAVAGVGATISGIGANFAKIFSGVSFSSIGGILSAPFKLASNAAGALKGNVQAVGTAAEALGSAFANAATQTAGQAFSSIASAAIGLGGSMFNLGSSVGVAAGALSLIPAIAGAATAGIYALGGAIGSLPALSIGVGAGLGTLALGFSGIADRFKQTASGGGGAAKSMSGVRNATYALTVAQRELIKSTADLNKARVEEAKRIADLQRSLRDSTLDEEAAADAVADARTALAQARSTGDVNEIGKADLAYRQSLATLDDAKAKTADLADQKSDADKKGVEGSDAVKAALDNQRDATERVGQAQAALKDAQNSGGGGGGAGKALEAIAPAAQAVVDELKRLKPAFDNLRLDVQQRLFAGIAPILGQLASFWIKPLNKILGETADSFNGLFKNLAKSVSRPKFIDDIVAGFESVKDAFVEIGTAVTGPLVDAFGRLSRASAPFVKELGDEITRIVTGFSDWIKKADDSGKLKSFFSTAADYMHQIFEDGKLVVDIGGQLLGIFFGSKTKGGGDSILQNLHERLQEISDWLNDPRHQKQVKDFIDKIGDLVVKATEFTDWMIRKGIPRIEEFAGKIKETTDSVTNMITSIKNVKDTVSTVVDSIVGTIVGVAPRLAGINLWTSLYTSFRNVANAIIEQWNGLVFTPKVAKVGAAKGSGAGIAGSISIPHLAAGGVIQARPGGTTVQVAEAGEDEIVTPESKMQTIVDRAIARAGGTDGGGDVEVHVYIGSDELEAHTVKVIKKNPTTVARSNRDGVKRLGFAG